MYEQVGNPKENKSKAVANANSQKQKGAESTFQFVDNRSESLVQRKLQALATKRVTQKSNTSPIQLARIPVGFDKVSAATNPDVDSLVTSGLANCIAVAVQDHNTGYAVMGHLNTGAIWGDAGAYNAFRTLLLNELERAVGAPPNPRFHVSLGAVWMSGGRDVDDPVNNGWWNMRHTIIAECMRSFGAEPITAGALAEFTLATGKISGSATLEEGEPTVLPPNNDPHGTAGDNIPYDRLRRTNERGHKLDKNMGIMDKASVKFNPG